MPITNNKRAFVSAPLMPEYDREGGSQRVFNIISLLRQQGWAVTFLAQNSYIGTDRYARILRQMGVSVYIGNHGSWIGDEFIFDTNSLIGWGKFDLAILTFWYNAEEFLPIFREISPNTRVLVDSIDLHFLRMARGKLGPTMHAEAPAGIERLDLPFADEMRRELNIYAAADGVLTVSQKETDLINDLLARPGHARLVPLMEDLAFSPLPFEQRKGILFIGNFRHPPNIEATRYLCEQILPEVDPALLTEHPVYIVGNGLDASISQYGQDLPYVRMVGWVPSLVPYLQKVRITVCPLLNGAGTKTKLIQALTVGTPTVTTTIGAEGLNLSDRQEVIVADQPDLFARGIETLLKDKALWERLRQQGRAHIQRTHQPAAVADYLNAVIEPLLPVPVAE